MFEVTIKHEFTNEQIENLLATALEDGSNYWAEHFKYKKPLNFTNTKTGNEKYIHISYPMNEDGSMTVRDRENNDKEYLLNLFAIKKGLKRLSKTNPVIFGRIVKDDYDANDADCFLQCALLGEVIYG